MDRWTTKQLICVGSCRAVSRKCSELLKCLWYSVALFVCRFMIGALPLPLPQRIRLSHVGGMGGRGCFGVRLPVASLA